MKEKGRPKRKDEETCRGLKEQMFCCLWEMHLGGPERQAPLSPTARALENASLSTFSRSVECWFRVSISGWLASPECQGVPEGEGEYLLWRFDYYVHLCCCCYNKTTENG